MFDSSKHWLTFNLIFLKKLQLFEFGLLELLLRVVTPITITAQCPPLALLLEQQFYSQSNMFVAALKVQGNNRWIKLWDYQLKPTDKKTDYSELFDNTAEANLESFIIFVSAMQQFLSVSCLSDFLYFY